MAESQMRARWQRLAVKLGLRGDTDAACDDLLRHYSEPHRAYHNLDHIAACLHTLDDVAEQANDRDAIELALWYHDAEYVPGNRTNEEQSAQLAERSLARLGYPANLVNDVCGLIMATDHSRSSAYLSRDGDNRLIADIDLVILAASPERYSAYAAAIEREAGLPHREFVAKRATFLRGMIEKPRIFHTDLFRGRHEEAARANLRHELADLQREMDA